MNEGNLKVESVQTTPFEGQKPGTSGLRKPVDIFKQPKYTENFVQSIFNALPKEELNGSTLVVGGDGRYFMGEAVKIIVKMAAANHVRKLIIGQSGILSTPAVSCLIRKRKVLGGIILTASHNPGGPNGDFGIKYNTSNGGPAPEKITSKIFSETTTIKEYKIVKGVDVDLHSLGTTTFSIDGTTFEVEVIDSVADYVDLMKEIFDFNLLKEFLRNFKIVANGMNGVTGPYLREIICKEFGAGQNSVINSVPLADFGGAHPDPNMTYAADFVELMKKGDFKFGASFDGDGDRNMLLGEHAFFINPCDSVAIIAANADCIPYFKNHGLKGVARSMPTSEAMDKVAAAKGMQCYEVPTGWKFFGNLMDAGKAALCGEESFGTGSDHVREKDGIWAFLAWLSILANRRKSVKEINEEHWQKYGRNYFTRYDYEGVDTESANKVIGSVRSMIEDRSLVGKKFDDFVVRAADDFEYTDTIDGSVTKKQENIKPEVLEYGPNFRGLCIKTDGFIFSCTTTKPGLRILFEDRSRIIYRLSGTGSSGATIRVYIEKYDQDPDLSKTSEDVLKPLVDVALTISNLIETTGRQKPTVIT